MPMIIHAIIRHYEIGKTEINWLVEFLTINKSYSAYGNPSFFDPSNGNSFISYSQMERGMPVHYGKVWMQDKWYEIWGQSSEKEKWWAYISSSRKPGQDSGGI